MFSSNKRSKAPREKREDAENMFGIGMPAENDDDDDDESLLAELAALQGKSVPKKKAAPSKKLVSMDEISRLASEGMRDIDDDDMSDADVENDADLLAELEDLVSDDDDDDKSNDVAMPSNVATSSQQDHGIAGEISERESMYELAITIANENGDSSKARRLKRGLEEIKKMKKSAQAGRPVNMDELPPPVATKRNTTAPAPLQPSRQEPAPAPAQASPQPPPPRPPSAPQNDPVPSPPPKVAPRPSSGNQQKVVESELVNLLLGKQKEFKIAALGCKKSGDLDGARQCIGVSKEIDKMVAAVRNGESVDTTALPSSPSALVSARVDAVAPSPIAATSHAVETPPTVQPPPSAQSADPPTPSTALEALEQRLAKYVSGDKEAKDAGNTSKARRMGRIVKQYQDAIKLYKAGRAIDFEELPVPPGYPPIPGAAAAPSPGTSEGASVQPGPSRSPNQPAVAAMAGSSASNSGLPQASRNEKEYDFLVRRQREFKVAALSAKQEGDLDSARGYLRQAKGLDQMIVAAQNGLRVDVTQVPSLKPVERRTSSEKSDTRVVIEDASSEITGTPAEVYQRLELSLKKQIETSQQNAKHYSLLGDLSAAKNFESLLRSSKQDLETVKVSKSRGDPVPRCHFEVKTFPIVRSHPELSDSEIDITIVRCINVPLPSGYQAKDMYVYVIYEFPIPSEDGQTGNTTTIKQTINPEFNEKFKVSIDRKSRSLVRTLRRQGLTLKVMYVRGFLKSDKMLGQATIKLDPLTSKCDLHECVDLMDTERGRKAVGGKIEVSLRIREPLVDKDAEIVKERWLVIDTHLRKLEMETPRTSAAAAASKPNSACSLEVLKFEKDLAEKQVTALKAQGKSPPAFLLQKVKSCDEKSKEVNAILKQGGVKGFQGRSKNVSN